MPLPTAGAVESSTTLRAHHPLVTVALDRLPCLATLTGRVFGADPVLIGDPGLDLSIPSLHQKIEFSKPTRRALHARCGICLERDDENLVVDCQRGGLTRPG
jgi:hypothetical protein